MILLKPLQGNAFETLRNPIHLDALGRETNLFDAFSRAPRRAAHILRVSRLGRGSQPHHVSSLAVQEVTNELKRRQRSSRTEIRKGVRYKSRKAFIV